MLKKRSAIVVTMIFLPLTLYFGINALIELERSSSVHTVISAIVEAREKSEKAYPLASQERLGEFVGRLDKVDVSSVPDDFRAAFESYCDAFRNSESDLKAGTFTSKDEEKAEAAYRQMNTVAAKYWFQPTAAPTGAAR
jgi:hypothetical protein